MRKEKRTIKERYFNDIIKKNDIYRSYEGIERGINYFRHRVVQEFIQLVKYNLHESFHLFIRETNLWDIHTKQDFISQLSDFYDPILGECDYFDSWDTQYYSYKQNLLCSLQDKVHTISFTKELISEWYRCNTLAMDGVMDNMIQRQFDFVDFLPNEKALRGYRISDFNLIKLSDVLSHLKSIDNKEINPENEIIQIL